MKQVLQVGHICCYRSKEEHCIIDIRAGLEFYWVCPYRSEETLLCCHVQHLMQGVHSQYKEHGESGSPCRRPWPCFMGLPGIPLSIIHDEVVLQISAIRSLQCCPNPKCCMNSSKYSQRTLSNAFVMSNFRSNSGVFAWWK
jgi:hypothetical protein